MCHIDGTVAAETVVVRTPHSGDWAAVPGVVEVGSRSAHSWAVLVAGWEERKCLLGKAVTAAGREQPNCFDRFRCLCRAMCCGLMTIEQSMAEGLEVGLGCFAGCLDHGKVRFAG